MRENRITLRYLLPRTEAKAPVLSRKREQSFASPRAHNVVIIIEKRRVYRTRSNVQSNGNSDYNDIYVSYDKIVYYFSFKSFNNYDSLLLAMTNTHYT